MTHVKLMGEIGEKFGTEWDMNVSSFRDMFRLIECQTEGFKEYLLDCADAGINFTIQNGEDLVDGTLDAMVAPVKETVIITPVAAGAGASDVFKVVVGALLIIYGPALIDKMFAAGGGGVETTSEVVAHASESGQAGEIVTTSTAPSKFQIYSRRAIQTLGATLGMEGVTGYLTPDSPSEAGKSYLYDGPENNVLQGAPVPLLYGNLLVGGSVINFGFIEDQVTTKQQGYTLIKDGYYAGSPYGIGVGGGGGGGSNGKVGITKQK